LYKHFGYNKIESSIKKIDEKELEKLAGSIPEIRKYLQTEEQRKLELEMAKRIPYKGRSKERKSSADDRSKKLSLNNSRSLNKSMEGNKKSILVCSFCLKKDKNMKSEADLEHHQENDCLMFTHCVKCHKKTEVKNYATHILEECSHKNEFKQCKRCKEPIDANLYEAHVKENKCNPGKNINSANRCPLCHSDIPPLDRGWYTHLVKNLCTKNKTKGMISLEKIRKNDEERKKSPEEAKKHNEEVKKQNEVTSNIKLEQIKKNETDKKVDVKKK
jgi:hypothetical protein